MSTDLPLELFVKLADKSPMGIYVSRLEDPEDDRSFVVIYANQTSATLTGMSVSQLVGTRSEESFPSLRERGFIDMFVRALRTGIATSYEDVYYADDRMIEAAFSGHVEPLSKEMVAIFFENVTQRKQTEKAASQAALFEQAAAEKIAQYQELASSHQKAQEALRTFELIAEASQDGLWEMKDFDLEELRPDTPCRFSNRVIEMLGYEPKDLSHTLGDWQKFLHPDDVERVSERFFSLTRGEIERFQMEYRVRTRSGETRWWQGAGAAIRDASVQLMQAVGTVRDITERKEAEIEMRERLELIEHQRGLIAELSTPILQIWDDVLALPLLGVLDEERAARIMDELLRAIATQRVRFALLDLTGVQHIDTSTANQIVNIVGAVRLLGARAIVTGLQPSLAQTIVELGYDLSGIETRQSLREALRIVVGELGTQRRARRNFS